MQFFEQLNYFRSKTWFIVLSFFIVATILMLGIMLYFFQQLVLLTQAEVEVSDSDTEPEAAEEVVSEGPLELGFAAREERAVSQTINHVSLTLNESAFGSVAPHAVDLAITYDPELVRVVSINPGGVWRSTNVLSEEIDQVAGRIRWSAGMGFDQEFGDSDEIMEIAYIPYNDAFNQIEFKLEPESVVAYLDRSELVEVSEAIISINY